MSIANDKIVNLQGAKVLYDDLRGRIKDNSVAKVLDTPADIQSFSDAARFPMELKVGIDPVQDLHGYSNPWPGGGGKNVIPYPYVETTKTKNGLTFTDNGDGTITVNGTATANTNFILCNSSRWINQPAGSYVLSGCPSGGGQYTYILRAQLSSGSASPTGMNDVGSTSNANFSEEVTLNSGYNIYIYVGSGITLNNAIFKPQIELGATATEYAPYSNICPITGWTGANVTVTGKNLIDLSKVTQNYGLTEQGALTAKTWCHVSDYIPVVSGRTYHMHNGVGRGSLAFGCFYDANKNFAGSEPIQGAYPIDYAITIPYGVSYVRVNIHSSSTSDAQFELGDSFTSYEEYNEGSATYPVSFHTSAGTVYGGELTIHSDGSGEVVIDHAETTINGSSSISYLAGRFCIEVPGVVPNGNFTVDEIRCDRLKTVYHRSVLDYNAAVGISGAPAVSTGGWIYFGNGDTAIDGNVQSMKTWLTSNPLQVVYKLSEPVAYLLTPGQVFALLGSNNVWADCGQINYLEYVRNTVGEVISNRFDGIEQDIVDTNTYEKTISEASKLQSFDDGAEWPIGLKATVEPVQDLHGYDHPWVGGGGKNFVQKGTTSTVSGVTFTVQYDGSVLVKGTSTSSAAVFWGTAVTLPAGNYILNGCPSGGGTDSYRLDVRDTVGGSLLSPNSDVGNGISINLSESITGYVCIRVAANYAFPSAGLLFKPMIRLSTETDATYAPYENICPITGWDSANIRVDGKNLLNPNIPGYAYPYTVRGITVSSDNGVITLNGTVASPEFFYPQTSEMFKEDLLPSTSYVFTTGYTDSDMEMRVYYNEWLSPGTISNWRTLKSNKGIGVLEFTTPAVFNNIWIRINYAAGVVLNNVKIYPMIRLASDVDSTFEPYAGKAYTVSFPSDAGTVYGGNLTVNKDGTGTLVINKKQKTITSEDDSKARISGSGESFYYENLLTDRTDTNILCDKFRPVTVASWAEMKNGDVASVVSTLPTVRFMYLSITTLDAWKAYVASNPIQIIYNIAPITYSLTPGQVLSLIGKNHVWADTGNILSLTYNSKQGMEFIREDTAGQINTVVNPVKTELADAEAAMAIVVDGDTAPKNITSGQYVFVKNHSTLATGLYHATEAISSGTSVAGKVEADADGGFNALNSKVTQLYIKNVTGTTTATGAITPDIDVANYYIVSAAMATDNASAGFAFWRGKDGYLHCFYTDMTVMANTSVKIQVIYCKRSELTT